MTNRHEQHIPGGPTVASIAVGSIISVWAMAGTLLAIWDTDWLAAELGVLASVMIIGRTIGQVRDRRRLRGVVVRVVHRLHCPVRGCDAATMSQPAMDLHSAVSHGQAATNKIPECTCPRPYGRSEAPDPNCPQHTPGPETLSKPGPY